MTESTHYCRSYDMLLRTAGGGGCLIALAECAVAADSRASDGVVHLLDAIEQGTFNIGDASWSAAKWGRTAAWCWPSTIRRRLGLSSASGASPSRRVACRQHRHGVCDRHSGRIPNNFVKLRCRSKSKGRRASSAPARTGPAACLFDAPVDWQAVGTISEVVFVASQAGSQPASGTIVFDAGFRRLPWFGRLSLLPSVRIGGILLLSRFVAFGTVLVGGVSLGGGGGSEACFVGRGTASLAREKASAKAWLPGLKRDAVCGTSVVLIAALAAGIYVFGELGLPGSRLVRLGCGVGRRCVASGRNTD